MHDLFPLLAAHTSDISGDSLFQFLLSGAVTLEPASALSLLLYLISQSHPVLNQSGCFLVIFDVIELDMTNAGPVHTTGKLLRFIKLRLLYGN